MEKKHLRSCTIVPPEYYVERSADKQIQSIIYDMERPGYVLVARQMGKTNLLLHTKTVLQDSDNVYVYIDFTSFDFTTERDCFEEIINIALDTNEQLFSEERRIIDERRSINSITSPTKQFTSEVRLLLKKVNKLVFILDEIDALVRCDFSDHIFSQIRSHYFQRLNFPDLYKLTYILSGVIEPKDIIKDPNISPFNIGEKIYLKDFTLQEFGDFVSKIEFDKYLSQSVIDRIYYWTNGHPRMTWDVCLAIEKDGNVVNEDDVDKIVNDLYLVSFDHVPIDSIRTQVKNNDALISAVLELSIKRGHSMSMTKEIRNRLYLAGIVDYSDTDVYFKNPIMEKALPYSWLVSLQSSENSYLQRAMECIYVDKNYKEAISILKTLQKNSKEDKSNVLYYLGIAYFRQYQNTESRKCLDKIVEGTSEYYDALYWNASNYEILGDTAKALEFYDAIIKKCEDDSLVVMAKIGKVDLFLNERRNDKLQESKSLLYGILTQIEERGEDFHQISVINFELALVEERIGNVSAALSSIDQALNFAQPNEKPFLLYNKLRYIEGEKEKISVVNMLLDSLMIVKRKPDIEDFDSKLGINQFYLALIFSQIILYYPQYSNQIEDKIKLLYERSEDAYVMISKMLENDKEKTESLSFALMLEDKIDDGSLKFTDEQLLWIYSVLYVREVDDNHSKAVGERIFELLKSTNYSGEIPKNITHSLVGIINEATEQRNYGRVNNAVEIFRKYFGSNMDCEIQAYLVFLYFRQANIAYLQSDKDHFYRYGVDYIKMKNLFKENIAPQNKGFKPPFDMDEFVNQLYIMGIELNPGLSHYLDMKFGKLEKNSRVVYFNKESNQVEEAKYKTVERKVLSGFAELQEVRSK